MQNQKGKTFWPLVESELLSRYSGLAQAQDLLKPNELSLAVPSINMDIEMPKTVTKIVRKLYAG